MATTINQAFQEFSSNLELTDRQESLVSTRRQNVVKALREELKLHDEGGKVIGSWDRHTLTRYLHEADVDVMVVLHYGDNNHWETSDGTIACLDRFRKILDKAYPGTQKRRDRNCITMKFSEFRLDVVPAFKYIEGYYRIPDSVRKLWVPTNPFDFAQKISAVNKTMGGAFLPLIKMVKAWNRNVGWPIRSIHLESLMYNRYKTYPQGYSYPSMLSAFFQALPSYLSTACYDPSMGDRLDGYLDSIAVKTGRQVAIEKAQAAAAAAKEAYEDQEHYPSVAINEWKSLMGEFFPSYG